MRHYQRSGNSTVAAVSLRSGIDTINNMDTIDAIDIIDDRKIVGTEGINGIEWKDESVGRVGRCYH